MTVQNALKQISIRSLFEMSFVKALIGLAIFLLSAAIFGYLTLNIAIKRGEKVTVPNLVNKSVVEALDVLSERGLELRKAGARNSAMIPENYILSQDPIPGTVVKDGTPVSVVISLGSKITMVPNLVGKPLREARVELGRAALVAGRISEMHYPGEGNIVLAQSPMPDTEVNRETPVNILLGLGPRPREYRLPSLIGRPLESVNKILDAMGLAIGDITTKLDFSHTEGTILDQAPRPGSLIVEGSSVSLVMSTVHGEGEQAARKFAVFLYQVPYGFWSKSIRVEVSDPDGVRSIYEEVDEPGAIIRLLFGYSAQCTVKVYLDGNPETERIYR
jgi:serine/threonine-protein kinase